MKALIAGVSALVLLNSSSAIHNNGCNTDADSDGFCAREDCKGEWQTNNEVEGQTLDDDSDGFCNDLDMCRYDPDNDSDGDTFCAKDDYCNGFGKFDDDSDGNCENLLPEDTEDYIWNIMSVSLDLNSFSYHGTVGCTTQFFVAACRGADAKPNPAVISAVTVDQGVVGLNFTNLKIASSDEIVVSQFEFADSEENCAVAEVYYSPSSHSFGTQQICFDASVDESMEKIDKHCILIHNDVCKVCAQPDDTFESLATQYGSTWTQIWSANRGMRNPDHIEDYQTINLGPTYSVRSADDMAYLADRFAMDLDAFLEVNPHVNYENIYEETDVCVMPGICKGNTQKYYPHPATGAE